MPQVIYGSYYLYKNQIVRLSVLITYYIRNRLLIYIDINTEFQLVIVKKYVIWFQIPMYNF